MGIGVFGFKESLKSVFKEINVKISSGCILTSLIRGHCYFFLVTWHS